MSIILSWMNLHGLRSKQKTLIAECDKKSLADSRAALLSKKYVHLVLCSILLATPLAWFLTSQWLQQFAYRYNANYIDYVTAGFLSIAVSILTLSLKVMTINREKLLENLKSA